MEKNRFEDLVQAYLSDRLTAEEGLELSRLFEMPESQELFRELVNNQLQGDLLTMDVPHEDSRMRIQQGLASRIRVEGDVSKSTTRGVWMRRWGWAAAVIIGISIVVWVGERSSSPPQTGAVAQLQDVPAGKSGAILTLADGSQLVLDSLQDGNVANQNGIAVQLKHGQLSYTGGKKVVGSLQYNTITTPRGRQFMVTLPDNSKIWLNAGSSIKYPIAFEEPQRLIYITGEVYCEVAKNAKVPFVVNVDDRAEVEVLGTHFDINAYADEQTINTTLLEGAVRFRQVNAERESLSGTGVILKPGQQAQVARASYSRDNSSIHVVNNIDTEKTIAWMKGAFDFNDIPLAEAMRQLARWYDIEVVYEHGVPDIQFFGKIDRNVSLKELLAILESTKLKYRFESGRKLIILNSAL